MNKIETINSAIKELFPNIAVNKNGTVYIDGIKATPTHYKKIQDRCKEIDKDYTYLLNDIKFQAICVASENNSKKKKDESNSILHKSYRNIERKLRNRLDNRTSYRCDSQQRNHSHRIDSL